ncbi:heme-degrading domain-containing protein [Cellulomonas hominis]|nr:heme-degrading domain-containing protein [Cellulomonas hominis]
MTGQDGGRETDQGVLARLEAERGGIALLSFDRQAAWWIGAWLRERALERGLGIVIDVRYGDQLVFAAALAGTTADHTDWARRKARLVRRFDAPSLLVAARLRAKGQTLEHYGLPASEYAAAGGACPVVVEGAGLVGTVAVSGLPEEADHELVVSALRALRRAQETG